MAISLASQTLRNKLPRGRNCEPLPTNFPHGGRHASQTFHCILTVADFALFPTISAITGAHLAAIENVSYQDAFFEAAGIITTGGL